MRNIIVTVLVLCSVAVAAEKKGPRPSLVVTTPIVKGQVNPLQTYVGTLYYDKKSKLASEIEGVVQSVAFREGEKVKKGEVLVTLDSAVLQSNIAAKRSALKALQADLTRQSKDLERSRALFERKSISQSSFDLVFFTTQKLQAQLEATRNELQSLQIQYEKTKIKAPFDGVVTIRSVEVGEWVGKGATIGTLIATESIEARLNIPARLLATLNNYKSFSAMVENKAVELKLKTVIPVADISTRTFPVEMSLISSQGMIEGMRIDVSVPLLKQQDSLMVPRDAVIKRFGQTVVFINQDGKAVMMPVQVIGYKHNKAAIKGMGLQENMRVVVKGNERIFPNMPLMEKGN